MRGSDMSGDAARDCPPRYSSGISRTRREEQMRMSLSALAALAALATAVPAAPVWAADPSPALTILEGHGQGSITDRVIGALQPALEKHIGQPVTVEHAGHGALDKIATAAPDGSAVVVFGLLPLEVAEATYEPD